MKPKPTIQLQQYTHGGLAVIQLHFKYNFKLKEQVKRLPGAQWSVTMQCWFIPEQKFDMASVLEALKPLAFIDDDAIKRDTNKNIPPNSKENRNQIHASVAEKPLKNTIEVSCDEKEKTFYLSLPYALKEQFKKLEGAWWHGKKRQWSALDTAENRAQLSELLAGGDLQAIYQTKTAYSRPKLRKPKLVDPVEPHEKLLRHFIMENKAQSTIKQYTWYITWFLTYYKGRDLTKEAGELVKEFLYKQLIGHGYDQSAQNAAHSALQNYYRILYNIDLHTERIPRPKQRRPLPKVLSIEEFEAIYQQCHYLKHKIILKLMYGCGLRRQEVCDLKTADIDFNREIIFVKGKGSKYRPLNPGKRLLKDLQVYKEEFKPGEYFIEGQKGGKYSGSSIEKIVVRAAKKAGLKRKVTPHMFRHSFATHHMERGTELRLIQEALGHASSKTTEIYTRVSRANIKKMPNLLDDIEI